VQREQPQHRALANRAERNRLPVPPGRERSQYLDPEAAAPVPPVILSGGAVRLPGAREPRPGGTAPIRGGIMPNRIMSGNFMPVSPLPGVLRDGGPLPGSRGRGADQFLVLIGSQPQHRCQPVQRLPPWPAGPALLEVLQRAEADPGLAGQLPLG
jgi:hypothetical protein